MLLPRDISHNIFGIFRWVCDYHNSARNIIEGVVNGKSETCRDAETLQSSRYHLPTPNREWNKYNEVKESDHNKILPTVFRGNVRKLMRGVYMLTLIKAKRFRLRCLKLPNKTNEWENIVIITLQDVGGDLNIFMRGYFVWSLPVCMLWI